MENEIEIKPCSGCHKNPPAEGQKSCQDCLDRRNKRAAKNRENGLCGCGKNPPAEGKKCCQDCLDYSNKLKAENRENGMCECGKPPAEGKKRCQDCSDRTNKWRAENRENGMCECGKPPAEGKKRCQDCSDYDNKRRAERNVAKLCRCGEPWVDRQKCEKHWNSYTRHKKYNIIYREYKALFDLQGGICAREGCNKAADCIDHCHKKNVVRQLLCNECNTTLGYHEKIEPEIESYKKLVTDPVFKALPKLRKKQVPKAPEKWEASPSKMINAKHVPQLALPHCEP